MRASIARFTTAVAVVIAMGAIGCQSKPKPTTETTKTDSEWKEQPTTPRESSTGMSKKLDLTTIYFDFDKSDIRETDKPRLQAISDFLKAYPEAKIQIAGNCDERGTVEYNLALGERRANAAKQYLTGLGTPDGLMSTISYGKERPKVQGHDEESWLANRNCQFTLK